MSTELSVTVQRIAWPKSTAEPESWYILITDHGCCKGKMAYRPADNDQLILTGEWSVYKGEKEFAFSSARIDVPTNPRDMLHYVCTRTKGLGAAAESLIWDKMGERWPDIEPNAVPRLSGRVYENFRLQLEALNTKTEEARVVSALMGKGCTDNMANRAWEMWKGETLGVVNADCYRLAELESYSFRDVDKDVRRSYGITDSDPRRIKAAVVYALRRLTDKGDTVVAWADLYAQACGLLSGYSDEIGECTSALFEDGTLKAFEESEGVALAADWRAESDIWEWVEGTKQ